MLNPFKKTKNACTHNDVRFLLLLCLGREPYVAAELDTYVDQSFFGALKRILRSTAFSHSVFDPFALGKKPMQANFSDDQRAALQQGLSRHFSDKQKLGPEYTWIQILAAALKNQRMQKAFLSVREADQLQYLQTQLDACVTEPTPPFVGAVYQISGKNIRGFAAQDRQKTPLVLDFFIDGQPAGSTTADQVNREISEKHNVDPNTAFAHTLSVKETTGLTDSCLLVFEQETGAMVCPPKNLVLDVRAAVQLTRRFRKVLDELNSTVKANNPEGSENKISANLAALDQYLPSLEQYSALRLEDYSLYRDLYRTPEPDAMDNLDLEILVVIADGGKTRSEQTDQTKRSLERQSYRCFSTVNGGVPADVSGFDLLLRLNSGDILNEHALGWFATAAAHNPHATIVRAGYDHYTTAKNAGILHEDPVFISEFDPLILRQSSAYARAFAVNLNVVAQSGFDDEPHNLWQKISDQEVDEAFVIIDEILLSLPKGSSEIALQPLVLPEPDRAKKLAIIIPTKDKLEVLKPCVESLLKTIEAKDATEIIIVDNASQEAETLAWLSEIQREKGSTVRVHNYDAPFNWADINNQAAAQFNADYYLFLNNDTLATQKGWDITLRQLLAMEKVGVVGAKLMFEDDTIQHAGVVLNENSLAVHEGAGVPATAPGYAGRLSFTRQCEAVTGAFLACSKHTFESVKGFDAESFPVTFNDIDFCFKVSEAKQQVIYSPMVTFYHMESVSRGYDGATAEKAQRAKAEHDRLRRKWPEKVRKDRWFPARLKAAGSQGDIMIEAPTGNWPYETK